MLFRIFFKFVLICIIISCSGKTKSEEDSFQRITPGKMQSWSAAQTIDAYDKTRFLEQNFQLGTLYYGVKDYELRLWSLSSNYDPKTVFILRNHGNHQWKVRVISFNSIDRDSIYADYTVQLRKGSIDSLHLSSYWSLPSQSDMKDGDKHGCMDGADILMEMADANRYKYAWYRCPHINQDRDPVFLSVWKLIDKIDFYSVEH